MSDQNKLDVRPDGWYKPHGWFIWKLGEAIGSWLQKSTTQRAFAIAMGFVWGMLVGVVVTLLIVAGV